MWRLRHFIFGHFVHSILALFLLTYRLYATEKPTDCIVLSTKLGAEGAGDVGDVKRKRQELDQEIAINAVPYLRGAYGVHGELQAGDQIWNGFLGYNNLASTRARERLGKLPKVAIPLTKGKKAFVAGVKKEFARKPYYRFVLNSTPQQKENLQQWLQPLDGQKKWQTCMGGTCYALEKGAGIKIPFPFNQSPGLGTLYLFGEHKWNRGKGLVKRIDKVGEVNMRDVLFGTVMEPVIPLSWGLKLPSMAKNVATNVWERASFWKAKPVDLGENGRVPIRMVDIGDRQEFQLAKMEGYDPNAVYLGISNHPVAGKHHYYLIVGNRRFDGRMNFFPSLLKGGKKETPPLALKGTVFKLSVDPKTRDNIMQGMERGEGSRNITCLNPVVRILNKAGLKPAGDIRFRVSASKMTDTLMRTGVVDGEGREIPIEMIATSPEEITHLRKVAPELDALQSRIMKVGGVLAAAMGGGGAAGAYLMFNDGDDDVEKGGDE